MATIYLSLSTKIDTINNQEILLRFSHGRINQRAKTNIFIPSDILTKTAKRKKFGMKTLKKSLSQTFE